MAGSVARAFSKLLMIPCVRHLTQAFREGNKPCCRANLAPSASHRSPSETKTSASSFQGTVGEENKQTTTLTSLQLKPSECPGLNVLLHLRKDSRIVVRKRFEAYPQSVCLDECGLRSAITASCCKRLASQENGSYPLRLALCIVNLEQT